MKNCRYCKNVILDGAIVCHYCNRNQNIFLQYFRAEWIGIAISIAMVTIAFQQLHVARIERQEVAQALEQAQAALKTAENVKKKTLDLEKETKNVKIKSLNIEKENKLESLRLKRKSVNDRLEDLRYKLSDLKMKRFHMKQSEINESFREEVLLSSRINHIANEIAEIDAVIKEIENGSTNMPDGNK